MIDPRQSDTNLSAGATTGGPRRVPLGGASALSTGATWPCGGPEGDATDRTLPAGAAPALDAGRAGDRFVLGRVLRRGRGGVVRLAYDRLLEREVALRLLPAAIACDAETMARLRRAVATYLELTHPSLVRLYDLVELEGGPAVAMEHVEGESLTERLVRRPEGVLGPAEIAPIAAWLCDALEYVHEQCATAHGNLTPSRVLVDRSGTVKVFGFLASLWASPAEVSAFGPYRSPVIEKGAEATPADDVYSIGTILYELLTGRPPFFRGDVVAQWRGDPPPPVWQRRRDLLAELHGPKGVDRLLEEVPGHWEEAIAASLAKDPAARPRNARELASWLSGAPCSPTGGMADAPAATAGPRVGGWRHPLVVGGAVALGVAAVLAGVWLRPRPTVATPTAAAPATASAPVLGPSPGLRWSIPDLGLEFAPVAGTAVLFGVREIRVRDFAAFVAATGHDATVDMRSFRGGKLGPHGDTWLSPGFAQQPDHPVVGVNQGDAEAFARWLTSRERAAGRLEPGQSYRLPTDAEWDQAAGIDVFEWGSQWPPPPGAGNFADIIAARAPFALPRGRTIPDYQDGHAGTAPTGSFRANRWGLFDLSGNAAERVGDRRDGVRGGSFLCAERNAFVIHQPWLPFASESARHVEVGFRVVCVVGTASFDVPARLTEGRP